ncbi:hypothetical protein [Roseovarius salinarum]|uniref:hypothetical protein n=1 Tax=Roseovarius salinarum TaxID=1981892 RepID=UPI000C3353CF|nr:hypothetical protein [Roseovarius salinarum]
MDRLTYVLTLSATAPALMGGLVIVVLALGFYSWQVILAAALAGLVLSWPAGYLVSRKVKRDDPEFDHRKGGPSAVVPDADAREV